MNHTRCASPFLSCALSWFLASGLGLLRAATIEWIGGSGDWNTATNWSSSALPGPEDDVVIDVPDLVTVTHASGDHTVRSIVCEEAFTLSGGALSASGTMQIGSALTLSGGTLRNTTVAEGSSGEGLVVATSSGGTLDGVTLNARVEMSALGAGLSVVNGLVLNGVMAIGSGAGFGRVFFTGNQSLTGNGQVVLDGDLYTGIHLGWGVAGMVPGSGAGSTLRIGPGMTLRGPGGNVDPNGGTIINQGTITGDVPGAGFRIGNSAQGDFINQGVLRAVAGGRLTIDSTGVEEGRIEVDSATLSLSGIDWVNTGTITANNSTVNLDGGGWQNAGAITVGNSTVNLGGTFTQASLGVFHRTGGTVNLTGTLNGGLKLDAATGDWVLQGTIHGGMVSASDGAGLLTINGHLAGVTLATDVSIEGGQSLHIGGGLTLAGGAQIRLVAGAFQPAALWVGPGSQEIGGTGQIVFGGSSGDILYLGEHESTTLTLGPGVTVRGGGTVGNNHASTLINEGSIQADLLGRHLILRAHSFTNRGALRAAGGGSLWIAGAWVNRGTIEVDASTLTLDGTFTQEGLGRISCNSGTVNLTGTLTGGLVTDGGTGTWNLTGIINGGTVLAHGEAQLVAAGGTLRGVTLAGDVSIPGVPGLHISEGLTLVGGAKITSGSYGRLWVEPGMQTIDGTGEIVFAAGWPDNSTMYLGDGGETILRVEAGVKLRGGQGAILEGTRSTLINEGTFEADRPGTGLLVAISTFTNMGTLRALNGGTLQCTPSGASFSRGGSLQALAGGSLNFYGPATFDGDSVLASQPSGTLRLTGDLLGQTQNPALFTPSGTTVLDGPSDALAPQLLEVMSPDAGTNTAAFTGPFAYGTLVLGNNTYVRLVDVSDNAPGTAAEVLYVNSLVVPPGCTLDLNGLGLKTRAAHLSGAVTGGSITQVPDSGPLTQGTPASGALALAGELDEWTFFGRAGQAYTIAVDTGSANVLAPKLDWAEASLLDPTGAIVTRGSNTVAGQTLTLAEAELPMDGTYRIHVRPSASQPSATGNYQITLWQVTPDVAPLVLNQPCHGRIETPYSVDRWTFSAVAGQQVQFDLINASAQSMAFSLHGPAGAVVFTNLIGDSGLLNLPADGGYTLTASGTGGAYDIAYAFRLVETVQTPVALGETITGHFTGSGQAQLFVVTLPNSGPVRLTLVGGAEGNRTELYAARSRPPTRASFDASAVTGPGSNRDLLIPSAPAGTLYVLVYGDYIPSPGPFTLQVSSAGVYLTGITPSRQARDVSFAMTLTGAGFESGTTVELRPGNGLPVVTATNVTVDSFTQITATFPPTLTSTGLHSVHLNQADGDSAILTDAFDLLEPGRPSFRAKAIIPDSLGYHQPASLYIDYENRGSASMPAPLVQLRSADPNDMPLLTLKQERLSEALWTSALPQDYSRSVTVLAHGTQPGMIHPGEHVRVPVYWAGLRQHDETDRKIEFGLAVIEATDARPMNWEGMTYGTIERRWSHCHKEAGTGITRCSSWSVRFPAYKAWQGGRPPTEAELRRAWDIDIRDWLRDSISFIYARWDEPGVLQLRPESISEPAWSGIVTNLRAAVGETLGDWVRVLAENAQYLARHGKPNANIDDLWRFEVLQANGLGPVPVLDAVTDASMVTPGVGLSLSRSFPNSISGRHVEGPFGWGWTLSWNLKLTEDTNGLVQIGGCCGGPQRRYEPDIRTPGSFFSMPGDTSSLRKLRDSTFELSEPNGTVTRFASDGQLAAVEDPNGNRVTASYDGSGRLQALTHTSGAGLLIGYNAAGHIQTISDTAGRTNVFTYDATGSHLEAVATADGKVTRYTYNTSGDARVLHALSSIERGGTTQHFAYDPQGRLEATYRAAGEQLVRFGYDTAGTVFVADQLGTNQLFYNESGLLTKVVDPLGHITSSEFDTDFRLRKLVLPTGEEQAFAWSKTGNLTSLTDELGHSTSFAYEPAFNRLASFTDARLNTTRYDYDTRGNLLATIYPNQSAERFAQYTDAGLPATYTNRRGQPLTYEYNAAGQITNQVFADGHSIQFTYDARANLASTIDGAKVTTYDYDPAADGDRLKRVTYPNSRFLDYTYDTFGRRIQMTDQDGLATKYEYDSAGRLWKLRDETDTLLVTYSYDPSGRLSRIDKGNGTFTTYGYDAAGQLLSLKNHRNASTLNSRFDYTYDRRGRRTSMSTLDGDWTYGYDAIGQLTRAIFASSNPEIQDQDLTYEYDALGNRVRTIENGVTNLYVANNLNQYTSVGGTNFTYDADGNLTFDGVNTYEWDQQSRLVRVTGPSGVTEYEYDEFKKRNAMIVNGTKSVFLIDPLRLVADVVEYDGNGRLLAHNVQGVGLICRSIGGASSVDYFDFDAVGSTMGLTGSMGTNNNSYSFTPFGTVLLRSETVLNPFRFVGEHGAMSCDSGLARMGARLTDRKTGRFVSPDPARLAVPHRNLYGYALNNPVSLADVTGFSPSTPTPGETVVACVGTVLGAGVVAGGVYAFAQTGGAAGLIGGGAIVGVGVSIIAGNAGVCARGLEAPLGAIGDLLIPSAGATELSQSSPNSCGGNGGGRGSGGSGWCSPPPDPRPPSLPPGPGGTSGTANATDPNEKYGPAGFGAANFLAPRAALPYRIKFENLGPGSVGADGAPLPSQAWASAPAQEVVVTDALSPALDWNTLRFTGFGFGDTLRALEPPRSFFQTVLPVTINGKSFDLHCETSLDLATGRLRAVFRSIDPQTSLPPDVLTGFLPPEDGTGRGQGFIEYTVEPRAGLPTGTQIRNVALISFNRQPTIATDQVDPLNPAAGSDPAKQALVTLDGGAPASQVLSLPPGVGRVFPLSWAGEDDAGGCGLASFDVFVSTNGSPFTPWLRGTTNTSSLFVGELGDTYAFYSIARDNLGNQELPPVAADAWTAVLTNAPTFATVSNLEIAPGQALSLTNLVQGTPFGPPVFNLGEGAPSGAVLDPASGILRWTPTCAQASRTYPITMWLTDSGDTDFMDAITFTVSVSECVVPSLGRLVLEAGASGRVPVNLISTVALTNLAMTVEAPGERLTDFWVEPLDPNRICASTLEPLTNSVQWLSLTTCANQWLIGTQQVAWLHFTAVSNQGSAFVDLRLDNTMGFQPDGTPVANFGPQEGRVVIVGEEPLLEALFSTNNQPALILYGRQGWDCEVQMRPSLEPDTPWQLELETTLPDLFQTFDLAPSGDDSRYFRALRQ